jgi:hypothetical protein
MSKQKARDADVEMGTGNVYADLGYRDANEMLIKAQSRGQDCRNHQTGRHHPNPSRGVAGDASTQIV